MRKGLIIFLLIGLSLFSARVYVEIPGDITIEEFRNPDSTLVERLEALADSAVAERAKLSRSPLFEDVIIKYTKDGELIPPDTIELKEREGWHKNRGPSGVHNYCIINFGDSHSVVCGFVDEVDSVIRYIYGPPFKIIQVHIKKDPYYPYHGGFTPSGWGVGSDKSHITIKGWGNDFDNYPPGYWRSVLVHEMLHAFRDNWTCEWDQFEEGMTEAMTAEVMNRLYQGTGNYGDYPYLFHRDFHSSSSPAYGFGPYSLHQYWDSDFITTLLRDFGGTTQGPDILGGLRYKAAAFAWWKVFKTDTMFMINFNEDLYNSEWWWPWSQKYSFYRGLAIDNYSGNGIEGWCISNFIDRDPVLKSNCEFGPVVGVVPCYTGHLMIYYLYRNVEMHPSSRVPITSFYYLPDSLLRVRIWNWNGELKYNKVLKTDEYGSIRFYMPDTVLDMIRGGRYKIEAYPQGYDCSPLIHKEKLVFFGNIALTDLNYYGATGSELDGHISIDGTIIEENNGLMIDQRPGCEGEDLISYSSPFWGSTSKKVLKDKAYYFLNPDRNGISPVQPQDVSYIRIGNMVYINWSANIEHDLRRYNLYRGTNGENFTKSTAYVSSYVTTLDLGNWLAFYVTAYDQDLNEGGPSKRRAVFRVSPELTATNNEELVVNLSWVFPGSPDGFLLKCINTEEEIMLSGDVRSYIHSNLTYGETYDYKIRALSGIDSSDFSSTISINVHYLNPPTNLQTVFEDSIVRLTWEDNTDLNKWYYIGKTVTGSYNNNDTTLTIGLYPYKTGNTTSFIDTMPIEGRNIYRVAAIDSSGSYWYSVYDTIDIPIQKSSDLRVISKPDTTAYIRFKNNSSLITASSIRKRDINSANYNIIKWFNGNEVSGYLDPNIKVESTYVYRCHSEQKIDNICYFWSWGENPDSIIYHWELDTIPPEVEISGGDYGIGGMEYGLKWTASDNGEIYEQEIDFDGDIINLDGEIREYTLSKGNYNGWYNTLLTVEDFAGLTSSDVQNVALFDPANKDISIYLELENPGSGSRVYLHYTVPEANQWYTMYTRLNDGNWIGEDCYFRNYSGDMDVGKIYPDDSYSAFVSKDTGDTFIHYSNVASVTNPSGGGQCPLLYVYTDTGFVLDNSLLPRSEYIQETYKDRYLLRISPNTTDNYRFMILDNVDTAYIDLVRFYAVDHPESVEVGVTNKGKMIPYSVNALPFSAYDNENMEWTDSVRYIGRGYFWGKKGKNDTLFVEFGKGDGDYITTTRDEPSDSLDPKIRFTLLGDTLYSRVKDDNILTPKYKDKAVTYALLDSVGYIDYVSLVKSLPKKYIKEKEATIKDLPQELRKEDGQYYEITPGDTLEFSFFKVEKEMPQGWVRDYMIEVVGYYTGNGNPKGGEAPERVETFKNDMRLIRSLGREIVIEFESDGERDTEITIYDVAGRVVENKVLKLSPGIQRYFIKSLPSGIYFIKTSNMGNQIYKVTVIR